MPDELVVSVGKHATPECTERARRRPVVPVTQRIQHHLEVWWTSERVK
jgi:hypothetical protein